MCEQSSYWNDARLNLPIMIGLSSSGACLNLTVTSAAHDLYLFMYMHPTIKDCSSSV
jgi:hypothetical protein